MSYLSTQDKKRIKEFHGHVGPWVTSGFILGKLAKKKLGKLEQIQITNPLRTPYSCFIDGIQLEVEQGVRRAIDEFESLGAQVKPWEHF